MSYKGEVDKTSAAYAMEKELVSRKSESAGSMIDLKKLRLSQIFRSNSMSIFDRLDREHEVIDEETFIAIAYQLLESNDKVTGG